MIKKVAGGYEILSESEKRTSAVRTKPKRKAKSGSGRWNSSNVAKVDGLRSYCSHSNLLAFPCATKLLRVPAHCYNCNGKKPRRKSGASSKTRPQAQRWHRAA